LEQQDWGEEKNRELLLLTQFICSLPDKHITKLGKYAVEKT
jgi:hypothetical protein